MIHDGNYYSIANKYETLLLLYETKQKITWMCHWYLTWDNKMIQISQVQDPDTPTYMESLSGSNICDSFQRLKLRLHISSFIRLNKVEYYWCDRLSLYDPWWLLLYQCIHGIDPIVIGWDLAKYCVDVTYIPHMREPYDIKSWSDYLDTPT